MTQIVTQVNDASLLAASHQHVDAYIRYAVAQGPWAWHDTPSLAWGLSDAFDACMSGVTRTALESGDDVDAAIELVLAEAKARSEPVSWNLLPGSHSPSNLADRLLAHGFMHDGDDPAMAIDLALLPEQPAIPEGVRIVEMLDETQLAGWVSAWSRAFCYGPRAQQRRAAWRRGLGFGTDRPMRSFTAWLGENPVGTSELFLGAGVAAVVWVGTAPEARGRGIASAMVQTALIEARRLGYAIGALTASDAGYPVYLRLGFRDMCRIPVWIWLPPINPGEAGGEPVDKDAWKSA